MLVHTKARIEIGYHLLFLAFVKLFAELTEFTFRDCLKGLFLFLIKCIKTSCTYIMLNIKGSNVRNLFSIEHNYCKTHYVGIFSNAMP